MILLRLAGSLRGMLLFSPSSFEILRQPFSSESCNSIFYFNEGNTCSNISIDVSSHRECVECSLILD